MLPELSKSSLDLYEHIEDITDYLKSQLMEEVQKCLNSQFKN